MTVAGTSHWMIQGLTRYWTASTTTAKATGNHTGAPRKPTTAKPTARSRPIRPPIDGSERRSTNVIPTSGRDLSPSRTLGGLFAFRGRVVGVRFRDRLGGLVRHPGGLGELDP